MKVLIVGAGIIGSIYGWALAESGHHVLHLVRRGRAPALSDGLELDMLDRRKGRKRIVQGMYRVNAVETLSDRDNFDLVVVPVKHYALAETLKEVVPQAGSAGFLLLTQNWHGVDDIDPILPRARYVYGDAKAGGSFFSPTPCCAGASTCG
jgi:2-dehydropantoate 2-reductase